MTSPHPSLRCATCHEVYADGETYCPSDGQPLVAELPEERSDRRPGTLVAGRYRVLRRLGEGGMGVVYAATQLSLNREVALKFIRSGRADERWRRRFRREAHLASTLKSPHVVAIHDAGETQVGEPFIVMELLEGQSLGEHLKSCGPLPLGTAVRVWRDINEGIAEAHTVGMVHRDIKPANIFVDASLQRIKVLDFGVAAVVGSDEGLTGTNERPGTPAYLPPERLAGAPAAATADVFALGVVMYEMLVGRRPYTPERLVAGGLPTPLEEASPDLTIPADLHALIWRCLSPDPRLRPTDAGALLTQLNATLSGSASVPVIERHETLWGETGDGTVSALSAPPRDVVAAPEGRRPWRWVAAVVLGAALGWTFASLESSEPVPTSVPPMTRTGTGIAPLVAVEGAPRMRLKEPDTEIVLSEPSGSEPTNDEARNVRPAVPTSRRIVPRPKSKPSPSVAVKRGRKKGAEEVSPSAPTGPAGRGGGGTRDREIDLLLGPPKAE